MFSFEGKGALREYPVVMRMWETPVPMPNTTVKTHTADDTWRGTAWESKWLPEMKKENLEKRKTSLKRKNKKRKKG